MRMVGANTAYTIDHPMNSITFRQLSGGSIPILYTIFLWCQQDFPIIQYLKWEALRFRVLLLFLCLYSYKL